MSIDESKSNNSKKINNSIFEDIINIEKEIEKFENTHKTLFNQKQKIIYNNFYCDFFK